MLGRIAAASAHHFRAQLHIFQCIGGHVVWTHVLGPNKGRYFLLMGEVLSGQGALARGVVGEVHAQAQVLPRALEIAATFAGKTDLALRYSRVVLTQRYKRLMEEGLSLGLGLEALAAVDLLAGLKTDGDA